MSINEVNNNSIKTATLQNNKTSFVKRNDRRDFYSYVEYSQQTGQNSNQSEEEKITPVQNAEENQDNEELQENITDIQENVNATYIQNLQTLNAELFDMGLGNLNSGNNQNDLYQYNFNMTDITLNDIKLFEGLSQKSDISINSFDTQNQTFNMILNSENIDVSYKSIEVSKTLFTALENAAKTGKSVRLDFGQDTSVILKISKDGKLSADFVPNEKAMETVLKNALPLLKAKFDEQNLPYKELNYRNFNQQQNKQNNKEKNKDE